MKLTKELFKELLKQNNLPEAYASYYGTKVRIFKGCRSVKRINCGKALKWMEELK